MGGKRGKAEMLKESEMEMDLEKALVVDFVLEVDLARDLKTIRFGQQDLKGCLQAKVKIAEGQGIVAEVSEPVYEDELNEGTFFKSREKKTRPERKH